MKKFLMMGLIMGGLSFLCFANSHAAGDPDKNFSDLKTDLQTSGISDEDINSVEPIVKGMFARGATKDEIKRTMVDLSTNGVKGNDLKNTLQVMDDMEKKGKSPSDVSGAVSQAIQQGMVEGKKGPALADKVQQSLKKMNEKAGMGTMGGPTGSTGSTGAGTTGTTGTGSMGTGSTGTGTMGTGTMGGGRGGY
jgi:hypothetical protein